MEFEESLKEILKEWVPERYPDIQVITHIKLLAKKECLGCLPKHKLVKLDTEDFRWREGFNQAISKAEKAVEDSFNGKK